MSTTKKDYQLTPQYFPIPTFTSFSTKTTTISSKTTQILWLNSKTKKKMSSSIKPPTPRIFQECVFNVKRQHKSTRKMDYVQIVSTKAWPIQTPSRKISSMKVSAISAKESEAKCQNSCKYAKNVWLTYSMSLKNLSIILILLLQELIIAVKNAIWQRLTPKLHKIRSVILACFQVMLNNRRSTRNK